MASARFSVSLLGFSSGKIVSSAQGAVWLLLQAGAFASSSSPEGPAQDPAPQPHAVPSGSGRAGPRLAARLVGTSPSSGGGHGFWHPRHITRPSGSLPRGCGHDRVLGVVTRVSTSLPSLLLLPGVYLLFLPGLAEWEAASCSEPAPSQHRRPRAQRPPHPLSHVRGFPSLTSQRFLIPWRLSLISR